jgi:hypothetical protein
VLKAEKRLNIRAICIRDRVRLRLQPFCTFAARGLVWTKHPNLLQGNPWFDLRTMSGCDSSAQIQPPPIMPRGSKSSYSSKQKREASHIEKSYEKRGVGKKEAAKRAWKTVNKQTGGAKKKKKSSGRKSGAKKRRTK